MGRLPLQILLRVKLAGTNVKTWEIVGSPLPVSIEDMNEKKTVAAVEGRVPAPGAGSKSPLLRRIMSDVAISADHSSHLRKPRMHRVGRWDLLEEDYQQVLLWAEHLFKGDLAACLERADEGIAEYKREVAAHEPDYFIEQRLGDDWITDGRIRILQLNCGKTTSLLHSLPGLKILNCAQDGCDAIDLLCFPELTDLYMICKSLPHLDFSAAVALRRLHLVSDSFAEIDLSLTPNLRKLTLECKIRSLDLRHVPHLEQLYLERGGIESDLDLTCLRKLRFLRCSGNGLSTIDVSWMTDLEELRVSANRLTELDITRNPALLFLECGGNALRYLDLSQNRHLEILFSGSNQISEINLSHVPALLSLECTDNEITTLDLSAVPHLLHLSCEGNKIERLDVRPCKKLELLDIDAAVELVSSPDQTFRLNRR